MGAIKSLLDNARGLLDRRPQPATTAIKHDRFDDALFQEAMDEAPELANLVEAVGERHAYARELLQDTFNLFWQGDPRLHGATEMHPKCAVNHAAINALKTLPDVDKGRAVTVGDKYGAVMGALSVGTKLIDILDGQPTPDTDEAEQQMQDAMDALQDALTEAETGTAEGLQEAVAGAEAALQQWEGAVGDAAQQAETAGQKVTAVDYRNGKHNQSPAAKAASEVAEGMQAAGDAAAGCGFDDGAVQKLSFEDRRRLADTLKSKDLEGFRKLLGRFRFRANSEQARKVDYGRDEAYSVTLSGEMGDVLASEMVQLVDPHLKAEFMRKLAEGQLLSRKWRGTQNVGDGPMIVCVDESYSMKGSRAFWAKAFTLALMEAAFKSKRPFYAVSFNTGAKVWLLSPRQPMVAVDFIESHLSGGTKYEPALDEARTLVETDVQMRRADIVFITDGEARPDPDWVQQFNDWRHDKGARVWGVSIAHQVSSALEAISDNTRSVYDFADVEQMTDLLRSV